MVTVLSTQCNLQGVDPCQGIVEQVLVVAHLHLQLLLNSRQDQICDRLSIDLRTHSCSEEGDSILCHQQKNVCLKNVEKVVLRPLKMRERKVLQTRSVMMDELEETHSRKVPAVELSPNELKEERIEKLREVELSKKMR